MAATDAPSSPHFSQPTRQILLMLVVLGLSAFVLFIAAPRVLPVFTANPWLNGVIAFVFLTGVLACFWQVAQLIASVRWIERFAAGEAEPGTAPRLLTPLAVLLGTRGLGRQISSSSSASILESVATRIEEVREITRYITSLLIFLGLLGTFYGLATTVPAVVDTIRSLAPQDGEAGVSVFSRLMTGLEAQLGGMGVAFGSSLVGLAGSLIVGLLELFAGHGQNRFYRELEEWLSTITRLGIAEGEGASDQALLVAVLDNMAEQMEGLKDIFLRSEASRERAETQMSELANTIERLTDRMAAQTAAFEPIGSAMTRMADGQEILLQKLTQDGVLGDGMDAEAKMRLRSIDVQLLRVLEEISAGRHETMAELRADIASLSRVISQGERHLAELRPRPDQGA